MRVVIGTMTVPSFDVLDTLIVSGLCVLAAGVFLQFGLGYAAIVLGAALTLVGAGALFVRRIP